MNWTELSDPEALRKERTFIEDCRKGLMEGSSEFVLLLPSEYANDVAREADYLNRVGQEEGGNAICKNRNSKANANAKEEIRNRRNPKTEELRKC